MNPTLIAIIGLLLIFCGWQQRQHERWLRDVVERLTPVRPPPPAARAPRPLSSAEILGEPVYPLVRRRVRPRFESYGVEVSFAPTVGVT